MRLPLALRVLLFASLSLSPLGAQQAAVERGPLEILLSNNDKTPELNLAVTAPEGWTVHWNAGARGTSLARIVRDESKGLEAIVIVATPLRASERDTREIFTERFIREMSDTLKARRAQRMRNDFWDGAYFQYELSIAVEQGTIKVDVRNWMLSADGYLVQFQCSFPKNFGLEAEVRAEREEASVQRYRDILLSVRRVAPEEKPAPKAKPSPKGR